jgi:primosomal replication protein N
LPSALNAVQLSGRLLTREALRYTPAGIPVLSLTFVHESEQVEARLPRRVGLEIDAVAVGDVALKLSQVELGGALRLQGFLANRSKRSRYAVLHVNEFDIE